MTTRAEKFTIEVTNEGMMIRSEDGKNLFFTPVEALMLLDILKDEEVRLKTLAEKGSPLPR